MSVKEIQVEFNKKYDFPKNIFVKRYEDNILVISPESANWIVLHNEDQLVIFNELRKNSIGELFDNLDGRIHEDDIIHVLTELEAKDFENIEICSPRRNGICIYLTDECNLRCKHCYMYSGEKMQSELTTDEIINLLMEFKQGGGEVATFTGGEIALREDIAIIIKYSKEIGIKNTILTNGVLWDNKLVDSIFEYIDEVQISIDGYDEQSNAKIRGIRTFEKSINAVDTFINRGIKVVVAVTPMFEDVKNNRDAYISFVQKLINKYYQKDFYVKFNYELLKGRDININEEQNKKYKEIMNEITEACYQGSKKNEFVLNHQNNTILENCGYGELTVSAIGEVYFCNRVFELKSYGNIRTMDFKTILLKSQVAKGLSNVNNLQPCCNCELKYICGGGCRITHFKDLIELETIDEQAFHKFSARKCSREIKEIFYKLMIETNKDFYR